jgi:hypothetical protein
MWIIICLQMLIVKILVSISCELYFICKYSITKAGNTAVRTTGITLLAQGNLAVTRPVNAADGRYTAAGLTTLSRQPNDTHLTMTLERGQQSDSYFDH